MTHTHTPGPWKADIYCVWAGEIFVCGTQTGLPVERQIANARLIASAPDLYAALEDLLEHEGKIKTNAIGLDLDSYALQQAKEHARAAIAKASAK